MVNMGLLLLSPSAVLGGTLKYCFFVVTFYFLPITGLRAISRSMKKFGIIVTLLGLLCTAAPAQEATTNSPVKIQAADAKANIGTNAIVTGKIVEVHIAE